MKFENVDKLNSNEVQQMYFDILDTSNTDEEIRLAGCCCKDGSTISGGYWYAYDCINWCRNKGCAGYDWNDYYYNMSYYHCKDPC